MTLAHYLLSAEQTDEDLLDEPPLKLSKTQVVPLPPEPRRMAQAKHLPELVNQVSSSRAYSTSKPTRSSKIEKMYGARMTCIEMLDCKIDELESKVEDIIQRAQVVRRQQKSLRHEQQLLAVCVDAVKEAESELAALEARQREAWEVAKVAVDDAVRRQNKQMEVVKKALAGIASMATARAARRRPQDDAAAAATCAPELEVQGDLVCIPQTTTGIFSVPSQKRYRRHKYHVNRSTTIGSSQAEKIMGHVKPSMVAKDMAVALWGRIGLAQRTYGGKVAPKDYKNPDCVARKELSPAKVGLVLETVQHWGQQNKVPVNNVVSNISNVLAQKIQDTRKALRRQGIEF
ncbi:hypothetical protein HPB47_017688 [Ixodes persulcatus]|uniref:Uncharacterized protein n=1 Tax=Ixodes persulcatus TaxID=34615 RepID=A0AC60QQ78_IXOPE|nr:hypothetical protein HPB47_017688 [Ixodes persulcatus]